MSNDMYKNHEARSCLFPNCKNPLYARGLCRSHYQIALSLIKRDKATWEQLEKTKKVLPRSGKGSTTRDWFLEN